MPTPKNRPRTRLALKIAAIYAVAGALWIFFSDQLAAMLAPTCKGLIQIAMIKGWLYVSLTAVLLYLLISHGLKEAEKSQEALRLSEEKFRAMFELASVGMSLADPQTGRWLRVNQKMCDITGYTAAELLGMTFSQVTHPDDRRDNWETFQHRVQSESPSYHTEKRYVRKDGSAVWVNVNAAFLYNDAGRPLVSMAVIEDISQRKQAEESLRLSLRFLEIVNRHTEMQSLLDAFVAEIRDYTGCEAVGIRVLEAAGRIPYLAYQGFSRLFYEVESPLSIHSDRCMCINVIKGATDPRLPFYTPGGSFYMNGTTRFLATVSEADKGSTRNFCNQVGYESVALIPIRRQGQVLGLIHVADPRENLVPLKVVEMLEQAGMQLGTAFQRVRAEMALRESEEHYRSLFDNMLNGFAYCRMDFEQNQPVDFTYLNVNRAFETLTGLKNVIGKKVSEVIPGIRESDPELLEIYGHVALTGTPMRFETYVEALEMWFSISVYSPKTEYFVAIFDVITERKRAEAEIQRLASYPQLNPSPVLEIDATGAITFANPGALATLKKLGPEYELADFLPADWEEIRNSAGPTGEKQFYREVHIKDAVFSETIAFAEPFNAWRLYPTDITERKRAENALRESLAEKDALLLEVHHRVKNNLQIVASLLNLQASKEPNRHVVDVLQDTRNRVHSMALLHEALYRSGNLARINFSGYVGELCRQLLRSFGPAVSGRVRVENRVARIGLPLEQSVPCGLIINELLSNALKHAFPGDRTGKVLVELGPAPGPRLSLCVRDNGVGPPPDLDLAGKSTLGLRLVANLVGQLGGELSLERPDDGGAAFCVVFPVSPDTLTDGDA